MNDQHLSDEAVAACADGYLTGLARERATRHVAKCGECAAAVRGQREAAWVLRAAPAPALSTHLLDRLRAVPQTTSVTPLPTAVGPDGSTMLSTSFAPMAALVPPTREQKPAATPAVPGAKHHTRPIITGAAVVALAGALVAAPAIGQRAPSSRGSQPARHSDTTTTSYLPAGTPGGRAPAVITPVSVFQTIGH